MAFDVNTMTLQGAVAIASATVGNKFVIDGCDATTEVLTQEQAVQIAARPASPGSTTTEIALAGSTDNHVFSYAEFLQGESTGGDFNTFYLYGHLEDDTSTVIVIAVCSSSNPVHIPTSTDVTNRTEIQFDLTFTPNAEVVKVADTSMYCTRGEFLVLKERAVTTHVEGTPTTGEAQTIYGVKSFSDGLNIGGNGEVRTLFNRGTVVSSRGSSNTDFAQIATLAADSTLDALIGAEGVSGTESERPYTATVLARAPRNDAYGASLVTAEACLDDTDGAKAFFDARVTVDDRLSSFTIALNDDKNGGDGIVSISGGYDRGESDYLLQITAPRTKIAGPVEITDGIEGGLDLKGDLDLTGALNLVGSSINYTPDPLFPDIPLVISGTDVQPGSDNTQMLGSSSFRWKAYFSSLQGLAPSASSGSAVVPVGCALFIDVGANYFSGATYDVGDEITITSRSDMPAMTCSMSGGQVVRGSLDLPSGAKFRFATSGNVAADSAGGEPNNIIFAVRVE